MTTDDFFRARLDTMIDLKHPLAVLSTRLQWAAIEAAVAPKLARQVLPAKRRSGKDLLGAYDAEFGGGVSPAGRPRLPIRLMASLLYLKNSFNLSDEELVERWAENVQWQFFSGSDYYEPRLPCDPTQIGRFRRLLGEDGIEQLFKATIECAVQIKAVLPVDLERVIVDSTVQSKAIAHPVDSRLLEIARHKVVSAAKRAGISLKQTYAQEGKTLRRQAGGYAHAKQFKRLRKTVKRQRTILGVVMREVQRKLDADKAAVAVGGAPAHEAASPKAISDLMMWLERAERIRTQQRHTKNKLYALHAPEVECISLGLGAQPLRVRRQGQSGGHPQAGLDGRGAQLSWQPVRRPRPQRPARADHQSAARPGTLAQAGHRRPGLPGRGRRQPGRADHPPRQVQVAHR